MLSRNEWDPIKTIIVSRADDASVPWIDPSLRLVYYNHIKNIKDIPTGPYPQQIIEETNEDLETLVSFLHTENCSVLRTDPVWKPKFYNLCPRDNVFVYDNIALAAPMPVQCRRQEWMSVMGLIDQYTKIITPKMYDGYYNVYNAKVLEDYHTFALFNTEPLFDASNILKSNDDIYYLVSNCANVEGAMYLQNLLPDKRVHIISNLKTDLHIHNSIIFLREGLMLVNPKHIQHKEQLPSPLHSWDMIVKPPSVNGKYTDGYPNMHNFFNMDILMVNPNLAVIEEHQIELRNILANYKIESVMLPMRHARTLKIGFRSVTLDLIREHK